MATPMILDACCGSKMFYFDKNNKNVLYVDNRKVENEIIWTSKNGKKVRTINIMPDIVADFQNLPFDNESFYHVVFDPPHLVNVGDNAYMFKKYGRLPKNWRDFLKKGFNECWRVLKSNGTIVLKWNATQIPTEKIIEAIGRRPLYGNKCGRQNKTHWMIFFKETINNGND